MDVFSLVFLALLATPFAAGLLGCALRSRLDAWPSARVLPANGGVWCDETWSDFEHESACVTHNPSTGNLMTNAFIDVEGYALGDGPPIGGSDD